VNISTGAAASATSPGNITMTAQRGKVILRRSVSAVTTGNDVFLYVTGTIGDTDKSVFAGDMVVSGTVRSFTGFSGSLTRLTDGTSYLIAGSNISILTGSNGAVTINSSAPAGTVSGTGTANYVPVWTGANTIANSSVIYNVGSSVGIGTTETNGNTLSVNGPTAITGSLLPGQNLTHDIGSSTKYWRDVYARTGSFSGDMIISGDLRVLGTSSIINSEVVNIKDNAILLNAGPSPLNFGGVYVADTTANTTGSIIWDTVTDRWKAGLAGNEINLVTTGSTDNLYNKTIPISGTPSNNISGGTQGGVAYFNTSTNLSSSAAGTSGQILQSAGTSAPTWVNFGSLVSGSNVITGSGTANYLSKFTSGNALAISSVYDDGTYVGIGTTLLDSKLVVNGNSVFSGSVNPDTDNTRDLGSSIKRWRNVYAASISGSLTGSNVSAGQVVVAGPGGVLSGSNNFWWSNSNGRVGIGTNVPLAILHVSGTYAGSSQGIQIGAPNFFGVATNTYTSLQHTFYGGDGVTQRLVLDSNGNILAGGTLGVVANQARLYVTGSSTSTDQGIIYKSGVASPTGALLDIQNSSGTSLLVVSGSGNVGIGTTSTGDKLAVNGSLSVTGSALPGADNTHDIGSASKVWRNTYSTAFSGSLTKLSTGGDYLIAGSNISLTTGSNGSVTIAAPNLAPSTSAFVTIGNDSSLSNERALTSGTGISITDGGANSTVTLAINNSVVATISGSTFTGVTNHNAGLSGSLTKLTNGSSYLIADNNISIVTGSTGAVTISNTATGAAYVAGSDTQVQFNDGGTFGANSGLTYNKTTGALTGTYVVASTGFSGSLTRLTNGSSYLVAGSNVTVATGSSGQVTIAAPNLASSTSAFVTIGNDSTLSNERSLTSGTGITITDGGANSNVTVAINDSVVATISGSTFTGAVKFNAGLSGSLTKLSDGTSYLVAGNNVTISSGSSGAVTISAPNLAPSTSAFVTIGNDSSLSNERSLTSGTGITIVDGGANSTVSLGINNSVVATISGSTFTGVTNHNAGLSGSLTRLTDGTSYLIAGSGVGITTGSSGAVTISNTASGASYVAGSDTQVQFNDGGTFGGDADFTFTKSTNLLKVTNISGSITSSNVSAGQVLLGGTSGVISGSNDFIWDNTNRRVGIGTGSPIGKFSVGSGTQSIVIDSTGTGGVGTIQSYNGTLRINNGGNNTVFNTAGGTVGIGTTNPPASKFFVSGSATLADSVAIIKAGVVSQTGGAGVLEVQNSEGTSLFFVSGSGRVGIATTSPNARLEVNLGGSNAEILTLKTTYAADNSYHSLTWRDGSNITGQIDTRYNGTTVDMVFGSLYNGGYNSTERMRIKGNGSVGIGTSSFTARLYVSGSSTASESVAIIRGGVASPTGPSYVLDAQNYLGTSVFLVSGSGNVGIGAAPTTFPLHVFKGSTTRPQISAEGTSGVSGVAGYNFKIDSTDLWQVITDNNASNGFYLQYNNSTSTRYLSVSTVGNVGIGTTIPNSNAGYTTLTVGSTSTGGRIDFNQSATSVGSIYNDSSALYVQGNSSKVLVLGANSSEAMRINTSSNIGIGTATYTARLFVSGSSTSATPTMVVREGVASPTGGVGTFDVQNSAGTSILFVTGSGGVGINTNNPLGANLFVSSSLTGNAASALIVGGQVFGVSLNTYKAQTHLFQLASTTEAMRIDASGNVGIGTNGTNGNKLAVNGDMSITGSIYPFGDAARDLGSPTYRWRNVYATSISGSLTGSNVSAGQVVVAGTGGVLSGSNNFWWSNSNQRVGIGTSSPGFTLEVNGTFAAATKSFVIPHPTKEGWKLRYGSLEGPENGVYARGQSESEFIDLPEYWEKLVDEETITVQITPIGKWQSLFVVEVKNNCVKIGRGWFMRIFRIKPRYFYTITASRKDHKFEVEYES
jgi:hypothetical protein